MAEEEEVAGVVIIEAAAGVVIIVVAAAPDPLQAAQALPLQGLAIEGPSIQTCLRESGPGAPCISGGAEGHTFVQNRPPARGKMCL